MSQTKALSILPAKEGPRSRVQRGLRSDQSNSTEDPPEDPVDFVEEGEGLPASQGESQIATGEGPPASQGGSQITGVGRSAPRTSTPSRDEVNARYM